MYHSSTALSLSGVAGGLEPIPAALDESRQPIAGRCTTCWPAWVQLVLAHPCNVFKHKYCVQILSINAIDYLTFKLISDKYKAPVSTDLVGM